MPLPCWLCSTESDVRIGMAQQARSGFYIALDHCLELMSNVPINAFDCLRQALFERLKVFYPIFEKSFAE